jgi:hypothetical protein
VKNQSKILVLLLLTIGCLITTWVHFSLPTVEEVRFFKNMDELKEVIVEELNSFQNTALEEGTEQTIKYISTGSQRIHLKTSWVSTDYAVSDFALSIQNKLAEYDFSLHGRANLLDNDWKLHISHQNTILCTIQIAENGTK